MGKLSTTRIQSARSAASQRGAVLIVALVILISLTIIGVAGVQNTTMEERMAGNYRDRFTAFQAAEAALRAGEQMISNASVFGALDFGDANADKDGAYTVEKVTSSIDPKDPANYIDAVSVSSLSGVGSAGLFIEKVPKVPLPRSSLVVGFQGKAKDVQYYRISGVGTGPSGKAEVILQSTYHR